MKNLQYLLSAFLMAMIITQATAFNLNAKDNPYLSKEFTLEGAGNLDVRTSGGSIAVSGTNTNKVIVDMYIRLNGKTVEPGNAEVQKLLEEYKIEIEKSGNKVSALAERKGSNWGFGRNNLSIGFVVSVPKTMSCKLNTSGGSIDIQRLEGEQDVNTSGGSINIKEIAGNTKANTSGGSINVEEYQGNLKANTSGGSINMSKSRGELHVNTSGGSIKLDDVAGNVSANTSGGGIRANIVALEKSLSLTTSGGSINAVVPKGLGMDLDLRGNNVNTKLVNFDGEVKKNKIVGSINGGGAKVTMATSGGSVNLEYQ